MNTAYPYPYTSFKAAQKEQIHLLFSNKRIWIQLLIWLLSGSIFYIDNLNFSAGTFEVSNATSPDIFSLQYSTGVIVFSFFIAIILNLFLLLWIIPYSKYKLKSSYTKAFIFFEILFYFLLVFLIGTLNIIFKDWKFLHNFYSASTLIFGFQVSFLSVLYFIDLYNKQKVLYNYQQAKAKSKEAETQFLSAQVNPHFLFNTLNNIYALTLQHSEANQNKAIESIEKLLALITYMNQEGKAEWITLSSEIEFIKSYLQLESLRIKVENIDLSFEITGDTLGKRIAPLLLINFVENAFKHGVSLVKEKPSIHLKIIVLSNKIIFNIKNSKAMEVKTKLQQEIGGIGLKNVKTRLALIYKKNYSLKIKNGKSTFEVNLILKDKK